eukprot:9079538-Pyramimonas_sp.AAC.1
MWCIYGARNVVQSMCPNLPGSHSQTCDQNAAATGGDGRHKLAGRAHWPRRRAATCGDAPPSSGQTNAQSQSLMREVRSPKCKL